MHSSDPPRPLAAHPDTLGKSLGQDPAIHPTAEVRDSHFGRWCEVGARTRVAESRFGDYAYVVNDSDIMGAEIGPFCSIAANVRINPGNHPMDRVALSHFTYRSSAYGLGDDDAALFAWRRSTPVTLGPDVWVGHGAIILPGVTIGAGAAIGAGAVVTKDVPDFAVVVGVPGRVLRYRFPQEIIAALHRIAWWNWPHERLGEAMQDFRTLGAAAFCAKHDPGG
ncbi:DapH/DapD/GlmU-related protein [Pararoseomonas indoligenes]|uniref:Chloramphenicol acetyltransferase n=1 Tax=Roseomonas indoligenes TaxID=2820811 RepID=A0A940MVN2_9PROT|nr:DapH/DapD/GlmU-related protein [Pararoseomonas indoligenes]MBP0494269.1 chloramphenicol acetyltransferase [Pararoseomonas indoligenes]